MPLNLLNKFKRQGTANGSNNPWLGGPLPSESKVKTKPTPEEESLRQQRAQAWQNGPLTKAELAEARAKGLHMETPIQPNKLFGLVAGALAVADLGTEQKSRENWIVLKDGLDGPGYYSGGLKWDD